MDSPSVIRKQTGQTNLHDSLNPGFEQAQNAPDNEPRTPVTPEAKRKKTLPPSNDSGYFSPQPSATSLPSFEYPQNYSEPPHCVESETNISFQQDFSSPEDKCVQFQDETDSPYFGPSKHPQKRKRQRRPAIAGPIFHGPVPPFFLESGVVNSQSTASPSRQPTSIEPSPLQMSTRFNPPVITSTPRKISINRKNSCIICERKRKQSLATSTSVIIKTNLPRHQLLRRGFSEGVRVLRNSKELPYVEVQLPCKHVLLGQELLNDRERKKSLIFKENILKECIRENIADHFIPQTQWSTIKSHLFSKNIVSSTDIEKIESFNTTTDRGAYLYMHLLPSKGQGAYNDFYRCLERETEHRGHDDLVDLLENALDKFGIC